MWNVYLHHLAFLGLQGLSLDSLARKFEIKWSQTYCECLEDWAGVSHVHVEVLLSNAAELHVDVVVVVFINELEILNWCLVNAPIKVKNKCLNLYSIQIRWYRETYIRSILVACWRKTWSFLCCSVWIIPILINLCQLTSRKLACRRHRRSVVVLSYGGVLLNQAHLFRIG